MSEREVDAVSNLMPASIAELMAIAHDRMQIAPAGVVRSGAVASGAGDEPSDDDVAIIAGARSPLILAGPGVVREGVVDDLRTVASAASVGVLNTWGAKGVFEWRSPHHFATVGLQARDFELGGFADADLIITTGLDADESPPAVIAGFAPIVDIAPAALGGLGRRWSRPLIDLVAPRLRTLLAAVTEEGWGSESSPLAPTRATRHYAEVFSGCVVAAEPGPAGYWVARTFPTTAPGLVHVPARRGAPGLAAACALVARLRDPSRPALAVCNAPLPDEVFAVVETADRLGAPITIEVWDPAGSALGPDEHLHRLQAATTSSRSTIVDLATDDGQLDRMIEVAGPIIAWTLPPTRA